MPQGLRDERLAAAVPVDVADALREPRRRRNDHAVAAVEGVLDVAVAVGDHEEARAGAVGLGAVPPKPVPHELRQIQAPLLSE